MNEDERKQSHRMKWILFLVFMTIFIVIFTATIATVFYDIGKPSPQERELLFKVFIGEVGIAVLVLFKSLFSLKKPSKDNTPVPKLEGKYNYTISTPKGEISYEGECFLKQKGRTLSLTGERKKFKSGGKKETTSLHWHSNWAEICKDNKVRMDYAILQDGGSRGYAVFGTSGSCATTMKGEFHILNQPYMFGSIKLIKSEPTK